MASPVVTRRASSDRGKRRRGPTPRFVFPALITSPLVKTEPVQTGFVTVPRDFASLTRLDTRPLPANDRPFENLRIFFPSAAIDDGDEAGGVQHPDRQGFRDGAQRLLGLPGLEDRRDGDVADAFVDEYDPAPPVALEFAEHAA